MPKYLGDITTEPLFAPTKAELEKRRFLEKIPVRDVLRAVDPRYDAMDRYQRNVIDWIVGTAAKYLGYERMRTTTSGVRSTYFYVYRGEPLPEYRVNYPRRTRRISYDDPTTDPWYMHVEEALIEFKIGDQAPCRSVYRAAHDGYDRLDPFEKSVVHGRVSAISSHLGYHRVRSSASGVGSAYFYRKFDLSVPRLRRSGHYPELYDKRGRPRI